MVVSVCLGRVVTAETNRRTLQVGGLWFPHRGQRGRVTAIAVPGISCTRSGETFYSRDALT